MDNQKILASLLKYARPEILKEFNKDSCIASTAIGIDVLTYFGMLAEPASVHIGVFNEPFYKRIRKEGRWPRGGEVIKWGEEDGSYSVGIGMGDPSPDKWAGHLVILVEKKHLIDLSIDQANRPKYGMKYQPICLEVNDEFFNGERIGFEVENHFFTIQRKKNKGFLSSPDWVLVPRRRNIVQKIISKIKKELKC